MTLLLPELAGRLPADLQLDAELVAWDESDRPDWHRLGQADASQQGGQQVDQQGNQSGDQQGEPEQGSGGGAV